MSNNVRWEGTMTAVSSVSHGEQSLGVVTYLRRERFLMPDGQVEEIPVVSGSAWRGVLRRTAADLWWKEVGEPKLTLAVAHAIWSGGALAKSSGAPLTGSRLLRVREVCPPVGLFGAAGGGRIVDGCVQVGKLIPICEETRHILPSTYEEEVLPSIWDLTQIEYYTKVPSEKRDRAIGAGDEDEYGPMRFGYETFIAGTRFYTWLGLTWATDAETSLFLDTLAEYSSRAYIGGLRRAGHGEMLLDMNIVYGNLDGKPVGDWRTTMQDIPDLLPVLAWLD